MHGVHDVPVDGSGPDRRPSRAWPRLRFLAAWVLGALLIGIGVPRAVGATWHGVLPVLASLHWPATLALVGVWLLGLFVHSFVLTAAAPDLTHRRALTLNVSGSAVANVVPLGGAAGVELNRRMMRSWGIDTRTFTGYTLLTNIWDVGSKLLLPVVAVVALAHAGVAVTGFLTTASLLAGVGFLGLATVVALLLLSPRCTRLLGSALERVVGTTARLLRRSPDVDVTGALLELRRECSRLVGRGWLQMSLGIAGYVALQAVLLGLCLHLTGGGVTAADVLAGFAVERLLTIIPITPGGVGVADLGLVGMLIAMGGNPVGVTAAAVLYRAFVFAVEIPVGGGVLGLWLLGQRLGAHPGDTPLRHPGPLHRVAHVTDVFLPRLGGIETHVDDLVRHQRARGVDAHVLTATPGDGDDPAWVHRLSARDARRAVKEYDVVHVHVSVLSPFGVSVARAAAAAGVPTLVTVHTMWSGVSGLTRLAAVAALRGRPVVWAAVSGAAADVVRRSRGGVDAAVLPNAVDVDAWRPTAALAPPTQPHDEEPVTLVSVMRLMPRKRPLRLLEVLRKVHALLPDRDVQLVVVGDGPLRHRMEAYLRRHDLQDQVRITGRLPRDQVLEELRSASLYLAPATKESFGIAALEARCAGLPVVAHRASGVAEFVRDRVDGVLVDGDAEMAVAVADLVVDQDLRHRITRHNSRVAPPFDWTDVLGRTETLYRTAAERIAAAAPEPVTDLVPLAAEA